MAEAREDRLLDVAEVMERLGNISRSTLYRLSKRPITDGGIRITTVGGQVKVLESELARFIKDNTHGGTDADSNA